MAVLDEKKTIIVTGGAGYVGSVLLRKLLETGYQVVCVDNLKSGGRSIIDIWDHPDFIFRKIDITDLKEID
jgi:nucleoside-diphosphate-sugar epimerase